MKRCLLFAAAFGLLLLSSLDAQEERDVQQMQKAQEFRLQTILSSHIFPPELIMQHQRQLELTAEQEATIREFTRDFQAGSLELQWELEDRSQIFAELVGAEAIDIEAAMEQFDLVLEVEAQIKKEHIRLLMDIRGVLTPRQRQKMSAISRGQGPTE
jgi:Spy/CpxP family protein refolding chaperone